jgi:hypothetical protein
MSSISDILTTAGIPWPKTVTAANRDQTKTVSLLQPNDERSQQAQKALEVMKQVRDAERSGQKSTAKLRLEMLKKQIDILRTFGGTTKSVARELARLARELGAAVKQYAGKDGISLDADVPTSVVVPAGAEEKAADKGAAGKTGNADEATDANDAKDGKAGEVAFAKSDKTVEDAAEKGQSVTGSKEAKDAEAKAVQELQAAKTAEDAKAAKEAKEAQAAKDAADKAAKDADGADSREFFNTARDLLRKIKKLLAEARAQHPDKVEVFREAVTAVQGADDTITELAPEAEIGVKLSV